MRVYSLQEADYNELEEYLEKIVKCGKKLLNMIENNEYGSRNRHEWDGEDDYDWKIKRGGRY